MPDIPHPKEQHLIIYSSQGVPMINQQSSYQLDTRRVIQDSLCPERPVGPCQKLSRSELRLPQPVLPLCFLASNISKSTANVMKTNNGNPLRSLQMLLNCFWGRICRAHSVRFSSLLIFDLFDHFMSILPPILQKKTLFLGPETRHI